MYESELVHERLAIRELLEAYADAVCRVDAEAWAATWAEDGVWDQPEFPEFGTVRGRDKIVAAWKSAMQRFPGITFLNFVGTIQIEGERANVRSYTLERYRDASTNTVFEMGCYEDVVIKRDGRWKFLLRRFLTKPSS